MEAHLTIQTLWTIDWQRCVDAFSDKFKFEFFIFTFSGPSPTFARISTITGMEAKKDIDGEQRLKSSARDDDFGSSSDGSDIYESPHLPAISPVSNISSSSGFFSCGSASSSNYTSKPNTPTSIQLTDKSDEEFLEPPNGSKSTDEDIPPVEANLHASGDLAISKRCDNDSCDSDSKNSPHLSSLCSNSGKIFKNSKIRTKHRRKHISLDDEIVIYESDSSLQVCSKRRNIHAVSNRARPNLSFGTGAISRRKSEENSAIIAQPSNQIVSILKRKDSSTSSNASLVTFSPNVIDIQSDSREYSRRQGILKKRSSLDESLRSHSPSSASSESEKGCLLRSNRRRNSSEEINHHGILKQKSYDSSGGGSAAGYSSGIASGGCNTPNSSSVQGILKKPSLTPSDHVNEQPTKHVSISEAVILAAAELCKDMIITDDTQCESYIKPILKLDNDHHQLEHKPKPILKKNYSLENEEIRSILKSRKSSHEETFHEDL